MRAGQEGAIAAPAEAAQSTKATSDLLRRFKEYATSVKEGMKAEPAPLTDEEDGAAQREDPRRRLPGQAHPRLAQGVHTGSIVRIFEPYQQHHKNAYRQEGKRSLIRE